MSGRRSQSRVAFVNSGGVLRISRDVVVKRTTADEFVVVSLDPATAGDMLTIAFATEAADELETVQVISSRPFARDGSVIHELRLARLASLAVGRGETRRDDERSTDD